MRPEQGLTMREGAMGRPAHLMPQPARKTGTSKKRWASLAHAGKSLVCAGVIGLVSVGAMAQSADSSSFAAKGLATSGNWDPNSAASGLSATLVSAYNNANTASNVANSTSSTANAAYSTAAGAVNTANSDQSSNTSAGVSSVVRDGCGTIIVNYENGTSQVIVLLACDDGDN